MDLQVQKREKFGKALKSLRKQGFIPAEFYGHGMKNEHLLVKRKEFEKVFKIAGENTIINLERDEVKSPALIYEVARDYLTGEVIHVDFYGVRMDEKIQAKIPVDFVGESPAVKEKNGVINKTISEIEVESLPGDLPQRFTVDLSSLKDLDQSIYVRDLAVPSGVKILIDPATVIVTVTPPVKEEEIPAQPVDISAVKVETEERKAEREKEKADFEDKSEAKPRES